MVEDTIVDIEKDTNRLFPVFLKLEQMRLLIVGGGAIGMEKLNAILSNSPRARITLVGISLSEEIQKASVAFPNVRLFQRSFCPTDLDECDIVITAVNDRFVSEAIFQEARRKGKLVNSADCPEYCDFYLGSVVQKGNLKIAISTNGKSPTVAKRLREILSDALPMEIDEVLNHLHIFRSKLNGSFHDKVKRLNEVTRILY